jgi:hypothetical protein
MGGKSSSSASSQTTNNQDNRVAVQDGIGLSASSGNVINVTNSDAQVVARALDSIDRSNAVNGEGFANLLDTSETNFKQLVTGQTSGFSQLVGGQRDGFSQLIGTAEKLFNEGQNLIGQTQKSVADAYAQAQTEAKGTIDNKTIMVIAVAGAAALAFASRRK